MGQTLKDAMMEDMKRMEDIAIEAGFRIKGAAVRGHTRSQMDWAFAVALKHLLESEVKRGESNKS